MKTMMYDFSSTVKKSPEIMTIYTTLYDLSAALSAEVGPDEEDVVTAAVMHLLHTHRVTCTGNLKGYRLRAFNARGHTAIHSDGARQGRRCVLGMRVPSRCLTNHHSLPARRPAMRCTCSTL